MEDKPQDGTPENGVNEAQQMQSFSEPEVVAPEVDPTATPSVLNSTPTEQPTVTSQTQVQTATPAVFPGSPSDPVFQQSFPADISGGAAGAVKGGFMKSKLFLPLVFGAVLLLGGGAAAYVTVFQKTPEKLWSRALSNTVDGLDTMLQTGLNQENKGTTMEGSIKVESPIVVDATMSAELYEADGSFSADVSVSGARINTEIRSIKQEGATSPDIYIKASGLEQVSALLGSLPVETDDILTSLNDQWFFLDHTLIDQYLTSTGTSDTSMELTKEDAEKISDKLMVVMRDRFFASDEKAVFTVTEKVGKEKFEDTDTYKVKVAVDKDNFKQFVIELKDAIKDTKLEEALKATSPDKSLEEVLDFDKLLEELEKADFSKATADVWIEANGGFIRNVRVYPVENNTTNYLDFGLNYTGGDSFPLAIKATIDDEGTTGTLLLGMVVNSKNADVTMNVDADMTSDGAPFKMAMKMSLVGTNDEVTVEEPAGATNILELLGSLQGAAATEDFDTESLQLYDSLEQSIEDDQQL